MRIGDRKFGFAAGEGEGSFYFGIVFSMIFMHTLNEVGLSAREHELTFEMLVRCELAWKRFTR